MPQVNAPVTAPRIFDSYGAIRLVSYLTIWFSYLTFMSSYAPRGVNWLSWHLQRVYNAVEYVKVNGYFSSYGFSIWSSCQDCGYAVPEWAGKIYVSNSIFKLFPYSFLNHFWGFDALQKYGPQIDRLLILIAAVAAAELIIICVHKYSSVPSYFVGVVGFVLLATAPWTYRMLLSSWSEVYFLPFFLLGILFFAHGRNRVGLMMLFF